MTRSLERAWRARLGLIVTVATVAGCLVLSQPAPAQQQTPEQALRAFVTLLNSGRPDCSLLVTDLREGLLHPVLLGLDPLSPQTWSADSKLRMCRATIVAYNGYAEEAGNREWIRTGLVSVAVAERTETLARLSVRVKQHYRSASDNTDRRIDVWVQLEDGAWRLASLNRLLQFDDTPAPDSVADWAEYRAQLTSKALAQRAEQAQQVQAALDATTPVVADPLACAGPSSRASDKTRDVVWASGMDLVSDQRRPTIDMKDASLHSRDGALCWQVRFAREPGPRFVLEVALYARSRHTKEISSQEIDILVEDGKALAVVSSGSELASGEDKLIFLPLRASRTGRLISMTFAGDDAAGGHGAIDTRRPFRWGLSVFEHNPKGRGDSDAWMDQLPSVGSIGPATGIPHRP